MLSDRIAAMQRVCFGAEPSDADLELLGSRDRWLVYRDLVRSRLVHVVGVALRRTKEAVGDDAFDRVLDEWLGSGGPKTRYLRHVPSELAEFGLTVWDATEPAWVADLARYEIAVWETRHAPADHGSYEDLAFDRVPVVRAPLHVLRLGHPVHRSLEGRRGYDPEPTLLCVYRDETLDTATRVLNPLAADLLDAWQRSEETITESVERIASAHGTEIGPAFVEKLSALIADFVVGAAPPRAQT